MTAISEDETAAALTAEHAFLAALEGSCRAPIAGLARLDVGRLRLIGEMLRPDGSERFDVANEDSPIDAERLGARPGAILQPACPNVCW